MTTALLVLTFLALIFAVTADRRYQVIVFSTASVAFAFGAVLTWLVTQGRV